MKREELIEFMKWHCDTKILPCYIFEDINEYLASHPEEQETYGDVYDKQPSERFLGELPKDEVKEYRLNNGMGTETVYGIKPGVKDCQSAEEILAKCACIGLKELEFKNEVPIIRPSEALEAMEQYHKERTKEELVRFTEYLTTKLHYSPENRYVDLINDFLKAK